ncbi:MAG: hypothetical protein IJ363_13260 [Clostridia bacterium]|nr:hypothetical protein [Clostridia bacterium]
MNKRLSACLLRDLLCALLAVLLLVTVSCRRGADPNGGGERTDPFDTTTDSETATLPPQKGPEDSEQNEDLVAARFESFTLNGEDCFEGEILPSLEAADFTLPVRDGTPLTSLSLSGWVGYVMAVDAFGYSVDGGETVYGLFATHTEEAVKEEGGAYALRFTVTVPLMDLKAGSHTVTFVARLADGRVLPLLPTLNLPREGLTVDAARPFHSSLTHINGQGPNGSLSYEGRGGNPDRGVDILDASLDGHKVDQDRLLRVSGWLAVEGGVDRYVWSADGICWYPAETNGSAGEPSEGYFTQLGYGNATENAVFTDLLLDLTPFQNRNVAVTVGGVPKDSPDKVVPFVTVTGLNVPLLPRDIEVSYTSDIQRDSVGADLASSDLAHFFEFAYGAGDLRHVIEQDGQPLYAYQGIHSFQASMKGRFAMTAHIREMTGCSFLFVRGTRAMVSVAEVPIPLYNFYETDGLGTCGGAGIYASLKEGTLTVIIKGLDPTASYRVQNHTFRFPAEGSELTMADDGHYIHVLVDGREITSIRLNGETEYPEHFSHIAPYVTFAETAVIVLEGGQTATVENTLVASTCNAQCGMAIRGGTVLFDRMEVFPYSEAFTEAK